MPIPQAMGTEAIIDGAQPFCSQAADPDSGPAFCGIAAYVAPVLQVKTEYITAPGGAAYK